MSWLVSSAFWVICLGLHSARDTRWHSGLRHWAISYKPKGRVFDSRWNDWNFSLIHFFRRYYGPGVDSASNRNDYQEYFLGGKGNRCVGLITFMCRQSWNLRASTSWNPQGLSRSLMELLLHSLQHLHILDIGCHLYKPHQVPLRPG